MRSSALAALILIAIPVAAAAQRNCDVRREVDQQLDASDLEGVLIDAGSGSLEVVGTDADRVRVRGVLCASDEDMAADSRLILERRRGSAWIETELPDGSWRGDYTRMDLVVEMPRSLAADIRDTSGELAVRGIAAVRIDDNSGELEVEDVPGTVIIEDGSGEIRVMRTGDVEIDDGSGEIDVYEIQGSVRITEDGSGSIDIRDVTGDVQIDDDGSGSIVVVRVGGNFTVLDDGSGSIRYRDIEGRVRVPRER